ncbi:MAG: peroxiredoxin family protein [Gammaproteobacteria bacterium]
MNWRTRLQSIRWRSHLLTLLLAVVVLYGVNAWRTQDVPAVAPDFHGQLVDGTPMTLADFRAQHPGKPVALHFWADWCPVCRTEEHSISRLVRDADTPVLTIAMQSGDAEKVRNVLHERELDWPTVVDEDGALARAYALPGVPAFVVIDASGRVADTQIGYTSEAGMRLRLWLAAHRP